MLKKEAINLEKISSHIEEQRLESLSEEKKTEKIAVNLKIFNPENRTLYAYGTPRRILYDDTAKKLSIFFHDQHVDENSLIGIHLKEPKFIQLEGNKETDFKFRLPKIMKRIKGHSEGGGTEILNIYEADDIDIEIAHQDTPFYYNPRVNNAKQLKEWGNVIAKAEFNFRTGKKVEPRKGNDRKK